MAEEYPSGGFDYEALAKKRQASDAFFAELRAKQANGEQDPEPQNFLQFLRSIGGNDLSYDETQELQKQWLEEQERIKRELEPDKYEPNAGIGQAVKSILLDWIDGLERDGQDKDRTR